MYEVMEQVDIGSATGKTITKIELDSVADPNVIRVQFEGGTEFHITDEGQSCCETRYMRTDDNLSDVEGARLLSVELRDAPPQEDPDSGEVHEVSFLSLNTDRGSVVFSTHNEHNGYYGGFCIEVKHK